MNMHTNLLSRLTQAAVISLSLMLAQPVGAQPGDASSKKQETLSPGLAEIVDLQAPESDVFLGSGIPLILTVENSGDKPIGRFRVVLANANQVLVDKLCFLRLEPHTNGVVRIPWRPKQAARYNLRAIILPEGQAISAKMLSSRGTTTSLDVQEQPQSRLQILSITPDSDIRSGQSCHLKVTIKNGGEMEATRVKLSLNVEHSRVSSDRIDKLAPGATYEADLEWTPRRSGKTTVEVGIESTGLMKRNFKPVGKKIELDVH
jgi:hypothetical protein